jgi:hypothetical protein
MKLIFDEHRTVGTYSYGYFSERYQDVMRNDYQVYVVTRAWYDTKRGILDVELHGEANNYSNWSWMPASDDYLERGFRTKEAALRKVIELADAFAVRLQATIPLPDQRTDDEILAAARDGGQQ